MAKVIYRGFRPSKPVTHGDMAQQQQGARDAAANMMGKPQPPLTATANKTMGMVGADMPRQPPKPIPPGGQPANTPPPTPMQQMGPPTPPMSLDSPGVNNTQAGGPQFGGVTAAGPQGSGAGVGPMGGAPPLLGYGVHATRPPGPPTTTTNVPPPSDGFSDSLSDDGGSLAIPDTAKDGSTSTVINDDHTDYNPHDDPYTPPGGDPTDQLTEDDIRRMLQDTGDTSADEKTINDLMQSQAGQGVADARARAGRAGFGLSGALGGMETDARHEAALSAADRMMGVRQHARDDQRANFESATGAKQGNRRLEMEQTAFDTALAALQHELNQDGADFPKTADDPDGDGHPGTANETTTAPGAGDATGGIIPNANERNQTVTQEQWDKMKRSGALENAEPWFQPHDVTGEDGKHYATFYNHDTKSWVRLPKG